MGRSSEPTAAQDRWCGEVSAHDAHEWSESGQPNVCDGVPLDDFQESSAASISRWRLAWLILRESILHPRTTSTIRSDGTVEREQ